MKKVIRCLFAVAASVGLSLAASAATSVPRAARSVHLWWRPIDPAAVSVTGSVTVRKTYTNSYFMVVGFNGGYCGIQDLGARRVLLFSVWDIGTSPETGARVISAGEGVTVSRFGGEGTGAKTMMEFPWQTNVPVRVRIDAAPDGADRVAFTAFVDRGSEGHESWWRIATISTANVGKSAVVRGVYSFIEDFYRNGASGANTRSAVFSGFRSRSSSNGPWVEANSASFTGDGTPVLTIDAEPVAGGVLLSTGGPITNSHARLNSWLNFPLATETSK